MSKHNVADQNADGQDDALGQTPSELQMAKDPESNKMSWIESDSRKTMENLHKLSIQELTELLEQTQSIKNLTRETAYWHLIEIELAERRAAGNAAKEGPFEHTPAAYTDREDEVREPTKLSLRLPIVLGAAVFIIAVGSALIGGQGEENSPMSEPVSVPVIANNQSPEAFEIEYVKAGIYIEYTPELYISYSVGTSHPAKVVDWVVCNSEGGVIAQIPLAMQNNIDDPVLREKRWKSSGASAFAPGQYIVTVRAESQDGQMATRSFFFDPTRVVDTGAFSPECKVTEAGK